MLWGFADFTVRFTRKLLILCGSIRSNLCSRQRGFTGFPEFWGNSTPCRFPIWTAAPSRSSSAFASGAPVRSWPDSPAFLAGNAAAVERQALLERLENTAAGDRFQWEVGRRARLEEDLDRTRRELAGGHVRIPAVRDPSASELGTGIELRPGELRIRFSSAEDLAAKLYEVSQAMARDWPAFTQKVENPLSCATVGEAENV